MALREPGERLRDHRGKRHAVTLRRRLPGEGELSRQAHRRRRVPRPVAAGGIGEPRRLAQERIGTGEAGGREGEDEDLERAAANLGINLSRNESASVEDLA